MFKNYLAILRNNKENAVLQSSVSDMESLIRQMRIMLDAVGKKVLSVDDDNQYNNIKREQNMVEADRITQALVEGIKVLVPDTRERKGNIVTLLSAMKNAWNSMVDSILVEEHDEDEKMENIVDNLATDLYANELRIIEIKFVFINSIPDIVNSLKVQEIERYVISRLMMARNYRMIFKQDPNKSPDTSQSTKE